MFLVALLCVSLVLVVLAARREIRAAFEECKLLLFGVRVRVRRTLGPSDAARSLSPPVLHRLPPPRVDTRPGSA